MWQTDLKALAKINLGLDVLGKRENGYHDVRMVMQSIYLYDNVRMERTEEPGISLTSNLYYLPQDTGNIAYRAAQLLMEEFELPGGVRIALDKHIRYGGGKFQCGGSVVWYESFVCIGAYATGTDGTGCEAGSGCTVLRYARHGAGRRNRRKIDGAPSDAEMYGFDCKTSD